MAIRMVATVIVMGTTTVVIATVVSIAVVATRAYTRGQDSGSHTDKYQTKQQRTKT